MGTDEDALDEFIDAAARALGIPVEPQWKPGIKGKPAGHLARGGDGRRVRAAGRGGAGPRVRGVTRMDTWGTAAEIAADVAAGKRTAVEVVESALARIGERDKALNAFTAVTAGARAGAGAQPSMRHAPAAGRLGPLAGVPFAVKNLFDVAGLPTLAGSKINRDRPAGRCRRHADRAAGGGRRRPRRRAQHGRVRLRLHRRERA